MTQTKGSSEGGLSGRKVMKPHMEEALLELSLQIRISAYFLVCFKVL